jgi:CBS domain-containing protein
LGRSARVTTFTGISASLPKLPGERSRIMVKCSQVMTENPVCCLTDDSIERIAQWMQTEDIGAVPVVDDYQNRKLIGIVTDRDIALRGVGGKMDTHTANVGEVMTPNPVTCEPDDNLEAVMDTMARHRIRRIPVIDEAGHLVGIVAQADLTTRLRDPHKATDVIQEISQPDAVTAHH